MPHALKEIITQERILASCVNLLATLFTKCLFPCFNKGFFILNSVHTGFYF
ncbi:aspartate-semialdehyde dehydrogenase [Streptococcus orisasini]|uniref:aspartate-semialdehyde dehydrogenase n=1 Tax=Streptococcus orisasini TaxID=1080071 RepID=UPI0009E69D20|nr:aspartate-semialdehyde dehydrogenase [Streptococcus orisasini]